MVKKLRIKFIIIVMCLVSFLLATLLVAFYTFTALRLERESYQALTELLSKTNVELAYQSELLFGNEATFNMFMLEYINYPGSSGLVYGIRGEINQQQIDNLMYLRVLVEAQGAYTGVLPDQNLRYQYKIDRNVARIAFLDKTIEDKTLADTRFYLSLVGMNGLLGFFIITLIITKIAIGPVERSLQQQQQLISDISHELKTPLTVINSNAEILASRTQSTVGEEMKWIEYIQTEALRMSTLIQNMLYLAKPEESFGKIPKVKLNLSDIAYEAVLPFESICFEKNLVLRTHIEREVMIFGNADLIRQLIVILLDNACKYSNENNDIIFRLFCEQDKVYMSVTNFGEVIEQRDYTRIFDRFYRIDKSRSRKEGGHGLGLSIAKSISNYHNAKITVVSSIENGTTFTCQMRSAE